ncbi:MAG: ArnT family glycosyltransferase [Sphingobacteriales bacterium]
MTETRPDNSSITKNADKLIWYFLVGWTILNFIQAYTLEIHADEAYYWLYSKFLDWGYFDHPPMVAIFIRIGDSIVHSELGVRLMTVLSSTVSLYVLWRILKQYQVEAKWFVLIVPGIFIFNLYGFMTTPDAPLFLFTALFYLVFKKYQEEKKLKWALLLALVITGLLYSKYHAVLLIGFTVLSDLSLFKRKTFWLIVVLSIVLFIPHILWQANHGYPSVNYHLFEQSTSHYEFSQTWTYFPGQVLMAGPLIGWFLFYKAFTIKVKDAFIRCLLVNGIGTFLFFLISSFRGEVQPQWTMIAFAPLLLLTLIHFKQANYNASWFKWLAVVNVVFIVAVRVSIITASPLIRKVGQIKSLYGFKEWAQTIKDKVGDNYVILNDGFQNASKYDFYTNSTKGFAYDDRYYRLTQFDIWPIEDSMQNKKAYFLRKDPLKGVTTDTLNTTGGIWYGGWVNDVRTYQKVKVELSSYKLKATADEKLPLDLILTNPYPYTINFSNKGYQHNVVLSACTFKGTIISAQDAGDDFHSISIKPGQSTHYKFIFAAPLKKGNYTMLFSLLTDPFTGSKNSRIISLTVE